MLRLGHDRRNARAGAAFEATYLAPLHEVLARCGPPRAGEPLFLLAVELKEASRAAFDSLAASLARYPALTGTVDVVLVGWHPESAVLDASSPRLGRQHRLRSPRAVPATALDPNVRLLSLDYGKTAGRWWVRGARRRRWLAALRASKAAHPTRRLRVHNVPVDATVYRTLRAAGVDLLGTKDLSATARLLDGSPGT